MKNKNYKRNKGKEVPMEMMGFKMIILIKLRCKELIF